jgi:hypothetical protein
MANSNGWGDGAANNAIGWGQGANNAIAWGDSHAKSWAGATDIVGLTTDPAASAFIAATGITGATQQAAIDNLVKGLKTDGIWSKMKAIYPFVTDNRNLLGYTEDFSNAYWGKGSVSITANSTTAPDGTTTADTLVENAANTFKYISSSQINVVSGVSYTASIYAKSTNRYLQITFDSAAFGSGQYANFDLINGVLGTTLGGSATITSVGSDWYLCTFTATAIASVSNNVYYSIQNSTSATRASSYLGNGTSSIFLWGAQFEIGALTTYQPIATTQQAYIASQFKYNLVNPVDSDAAFRLVFNGGWTHSSTGATPNGTNGYADTKLVPSSVLSLNNASLSIYSRTDNINDNYDIGSSTPAYTSPFALGMKNDATVGVYFVNDFTPFQNASANSLGLQTISRLVSSEIKINKNSSTRQTLTKISNVINSLPISIGALNVGGIITRYSNRQYAFSHIGDGLTDTEAANLYTRVQAYQTSLSRNV